MSFDTRIKPYSLVGEPDAAMVAKIDEMFDALFDDLGTLGSSETGHNLLSGEHADTVTASVTRGGLITGQFISLQNTTKWAQLAIGATGRFLKSDGVDASWGQINESEIVDGTILARVAANETISGTWTLSGPRLASGTYLSSNLGQRIISHDGSADVRVGDPVANNNSTITFYAAAAQKMQMTTSALTFADTMVVRSGTGSASAPAFSHWSDTNTGIYFDGSDGLLLSTGGTLRVTLNTTELISTLPIRTPTLRGSASSGGTLTLQSTSHATKGGVIIDQDWLEFDEITAPSSPSANKGRLYVKDSGGTTKLYFKDSAGTETDLLSGGGGGGTVSVDPAGALDGDGNGGSPLAVRVDGSSIQINGSNELEVIAIPGSGDVNGPGSAVDENVVVFDGTSGKLIKDSGVASADVLAVSGGFPGGTTNFLRADGSFAAPAAGSSEWTTQVTKSLDQSVTNNTTLQNDSELTISIGSGEVWLVELLLVYTCNDAGRDMNINFALPNAFGWHRSISAFNVSDGLAQSTGVQLNNSTTIGSSITLGGDAGATLRVHWHQMMFRAGSAGAVTFQFANGLANPANTCTTKAGSILRGRKLA